MAFLVILGGIIALFTIGPVLLIAAVALWAVSPVLFLIITGLLIFGFIASVP